MHQAINQYDFLLGSELLLEQAREPEHAVLDESRVDTVLELLLQGIARRKEES